MSHQVVRGRGPQHGFAHPGDQGPEGAERQDRSPGGGPVQIPGPRLGVMLAVPGLSSGRGRAQPTPDGQ